MYHMKTITLSMARTVVTTPQSMTVGSLKAPS